MDQVTLQSLFNATYGWGKLEQQELTFMFSKFQDYPKKFINIISLMS